LGALDGRTALVTGGGGGIGAGIARVFAREGARVLLVEGDAGRAEATLAEIEAAGGAARALVADVRDAGTAEAARSAAIALAGGPLDVLVNNVGDYRPAGLFAESSEEDWDALYAVNLLHVLRFTRALLPDMLTRGAGAIVNVATVEAFRGIPANAVYSAFKAAVVAFTRSLAVEVGNHGVRVNAIAPDVTDTLQTPYHRWVPAADRGRVPAWVPVGRFGTPDDVGEVALFLASDASRFVTGQTLAADGGTLAASGWYKRLPGERWTNRPRDP
jgi:2-hydroxycyclohexanecarboxyl-CoA dehydrogenase